MTFQGINQPHEGFTIPWDTRGNLGRSTEGTSWVTPESQSPEASREGRVREVQGGAEEVSVKFRKIWKHVHDLLIE